MIEVADEAQNPTGLSAAVTGDDRDGWRVVVVVTTGDTEYEFHGSKTYVYKEHAQHHAVRLIHMMNVSLNGECGCREIPRAQA